MALDSEQPTFRPDYRQPIVDYDGLSEQTFATPNPMLLDGEVPEAIQKVLDAAHYKSYQNPGGLEPDEVQQELFSSAELRVIFRGDQPIGTMWLMREPTMDTYFWQGLATDELDAASLEDIILLANSEYRPPEAAELTRPATPKLERFLDPGAGFADALTSEFFAQPVRADLLTHQEVADLM